MASSPPPSPAYTHRFAFLCKTYRGDLTRCLKLVESLARFNPEQFPLYVVVTPGDEPLFRATLPTYDWLHLMTDEAVCPEDLFTEPLPGYELGYMNQQVVKLCFYKTGLAEHYLCLDADGQFIRPVYASDFFAEDGRPYTVLYQGKPNALDVETRRYDSHFRAWLERIQAFYGMRDARFVSCSGFTLLSAFALHTLHSECLTPKGMRVRNLLALAPVEFSWYTQWLLHRHPHDFLPVEPWFHIFHYKRHYHESRQHLVRLEDMTQRYIGVCLNSNWHPPDTYEDPAPWRLQWHTLQGKARLRLHKIFRGALKKR
jgi:hypothetical protein